VLSYFAAGAQHHPRLGGVLRQDVGISSRQCGSRLSSPSCCWQLTLIVGISWALLSHDSVWRGPVAVIAGLFVGTISGLLGVAGGEFIAYWAPFVVVGEGAAAQS
jgi:hypothetical protein